MENLHKNFDEIAAVNTGEIGNESSGVNNDTKMFDHLESPDLAIQTCIGSVETYQGDLPETFNDALYKKDFEDPNLENVDFSSGCEEKEKRQQLSDGDSTYVISDINSKDKFSSGYFDCTGLVAVGRDKTTGENISFASHCPLYSENSINNPTFKKLQVDLQSNLDRLKSLSEEGTIDVIVFGGVAIDKYVDHRKKYNFMLNMYKEKVSTSLGFSPISVGGPKPDLKFDGADNMYFDCKNRRLYLLRPKFSEEVTGIPKKL